MPDTNTTPLLQAYYPESLATNDLFLRAHTSNETWQLTDSYLNAALLLYFRLVSREVEHFNSKQLVEKKTVVRDGVRLSVGRIIDGMNLLETADLDTLNLGNLGIKTMIPVIDRFSPLAYSVGQHVHWNVVKHRGMETCLRVSLQHGFLCSTG